MSETADNVCTFQVVATQGYTGSLRKGERKFSFDSSHLQASADTEGRKEGLFASATKRNAQLSDKQ